ncbi:MAG: C4-type zinc ribbon domain-containing protein [Puniceicoccales bacterium]|jgi:predicted  nucleic acid-binding Zn-ribbon protein|nr:C4-type zinc ribbon domain-containing protein [Puniceicoccales bacterium]
MIGQEEVNLILILQGYDGRLVAISERLENLSKDRAEIEKAIEIEKKKVADSKAMIFDAKMKLDKANLELESLNQKLMELKIRQASVKKSTEYNLLQNQAAAMAEKIEQLEDEIVTSLYSSDDLKIVSDKMGMEANLRINSLNDELSRNLSLIEDISKNISELNLKIDGLRKNLVNRDLLRMYDLARRGVKRMPVVIPVEDGRCKGCNIRVSNDILVALRSSGSLVQCEACGRLLYGKEQEQENGFDDENG